MFLISRTQASVLSVSPLFLFSVSFFSPSFHPVGLYSQNSTTLQLTCSRSLAVSLFYFLNSQFSSFPSLNTFTSFTSTLVFSLLHSRNKTQNTNHKSQIKAFHQLTFFNMLGTKSTVVLAFIAISAQLAVAAPPACLLAAVKYGIPPDDDLSMLIFQLVLKTTPPMWLFSAVPILPTSRLRSKSSVVTMYKLR